MANDTDPGAGRQTVSRNYRSSNILTGVVFITIGALFFIDRQGWSWGWNLSFSRLWPGLLIVMGVAQMMSSGWTDARPVDATTETDFRRERILRGRRMSGMWWLFIGGIMLMHQNHWMTLHQSWPLFIIAGGLSMLFGRNHSRRREK
jgi:hypothetical protein